MKTKIKRRITGIFHILLLLSTFIIATPTQACACGMLVASYSKEISMKGERGVVIYDSETRTEQMAIDFQLSGSSNESALVVPTPVQAEIGQIKIAAIDDLEDLVSPPSQIKPIPMGMSDNAGSAKSVTVLERKEVGNFEVAALKANDYRDLFAWTKENGFRLEKEAEGPVRSYIDSDFVLNVIKLKKKQTDSDINPLKFTFQTNKLFYPLMEIKDSRDSEKDKSLDLYLLSDQELTGFSEYADINNRLYAQNTLEDAIEKTVEKDFSNLDFSSDYYLTYIDTSNYSNEGLMLSLGNPEMRTYEPLGLDYSAPSYDWVYYVVLVLFVTAIVTVLFFENWKRWLMELAKPKADNLTKQ